MAPSWPLGRLSGFGRPGATEMQTLDDMLAQHLLTADQHGQIAAWVAAAKTPEAILEMPADLWRTLALASVLMGFDADLESGSLEATP
jgi:hypothetical protein